MVDGKTLIDFFKDARWKELLKKFVEEGYLTDTEAKILKIIRVLWNKEDLVERERVLDYAEDLALSKDELPQYFEEVEKDGTVYFKLKETARIYLIEKLNAAFLGVKVKEKIEVGEETFEITVPKEVYIELVDIVYDKNLNPRYYIYRLGKKTTQVFLLITRQKHIEQGIEYLRIKKCDNPYDYLSERKWAEILRKLMPKQEAAYEAGHLPVSDKVFIYEEEKPLEEKIRKLSRESLLRLIEKAINGFDPVWAKIGLGLAIRPTKIQNTLPYSGTHVLVIDKTLTGKTLMGRLIGEALPSVSIASLTGYASSQEYVESILNGINYPIFIDELEEEKRDVGAYLLNLLRSGEIEIARAGRRIITKTWASLVFTANAMGRDIEHMRKETLKIMMKITPNFEGLASRLSCFVYYQFKQYSGNSYENLKYRELIECLGNKLGEIFAYFIGRKEFYNFLHKEWSDEHKNLLMKVVEGIDDEQLWAFCKNLSFNYIKLNSLALKMALWDFPELANITLAELDTKEEIIPQILEKAKEYKDLLETITINSLQKFLSPEIALELMKVRYKTLTEKSSLAQKLVEFIDKAYSLGYEIITHKEIELNDELKSFYDIKFSKGYKYLSKVISRLNPKIIKILESFGLEVGSNYIKIVDRAKWENFRQIL